MFQRSISETAPTINTLTQFAQSQGISQGGSANLAYQQSNAIQSRNREVASRTLLSQMLQSEGLAQNYLGLAGSGEQARRANRTSFFDQLIGLGGGLEARDIGKNRYNDAGDDYDTEYEKE